MTSSPSSWWANKTVWVTGASSGIGEGVAYDLHLRGARLVLSARREEELNRVRDRCIRNGGQQGGSSSGLFDPVVLPLDLNDLDSLPTKAREAAHKLGGRHVQVIVHSGGRGMRAAASDTSASVEHELMNVNYFAAVELTRAVLPDMIRHREGTIVVISSVQGRVPLPDRSSYSASKHALHGYFNSLRMEVKSKGVQVTMVLPGYVATNLSNAAATADGSLYGKTDSTTAKGYTPAHVAERISKGVAKGRREIWIMQLKGRFAIWMQVLAPAVLEWALSRGIGHSRASS